MNKKGRCRSAGQSRVAHVRDARHQLESDGGDEARGASEDKELRILSVDDDETRVRRDAHSTAINGGVETGEA
jgi:hypothetical protein